jgi:hypothetical protein
MKKLILGILMLFVVFGCITQQSEDNTLKPDMADEIENNTFSVSQPVIEVLQSGDVSVVQINSVSKDGGSENVFALDEYPSQFDDVELYSDSFIQLNNSQIEWLEDSERVWITPMLDNGTGILFNAIYSKDVECNDEKVTILGKEYELDKLENGTVGGDDKWKARVEVEGEPTEPGSSYNDVCPTRVVIYLDGYFSDLANDEQINLFRNDNTILFEFKQLGDIPQIIITATKPIGTIAQQYGTFNFTIIDNYDVAAYNESIVIDKNGFSAIFEPPIPETAQGIDIELERTDTHDVKIDMPNGEWSIITMKNKTLVIGKEVGTYRPNHGDSITIGNRTWIFWNWSTEEMWATLMDGDNGEKMNITAGDMVASEGMYLNVWIVSTLGYGWGSNWVWLSTFDETINLTDPQNNVTVEWGTRELEEGGQQDTLESIYVPSSSPIFQKLTG